MKTIILFALSLVLTGLFAGCGGGDGGSGSAATSPSVKADGTCTQKFIDDVNAYMTTCGTYIDTSSTFDGTKLVAACDALTSVHKSSVQCKAQSFASYSTSDSQKQCLGIRKDESVPTGTIMVKAAFFHDACAKFKNIVNPLLSKPSIEISVTDTNQEARSHALDDGSGTAAYFSLLIDNVATFNATVRKNAHARYTVLGGGFYESDINFQDGENTCLLTAKSPREKDFKKYFNVGEKWVTLLAPETTYQPESVKVTMSIYRTGVENTLYLSCTLARDFKNKNHLDIINEVLSPALKIQSTPNAQ